ncbi:putative voltage and ligand gated potassium channel, partial [Operophtera brumata]
MMSGCLVVTGLTVASLALVISLYMRPEETFRARYRLIIKEMSRILRDLSYQFLSELAKYMETINYIPGDAIIQRSSKKSSIIYITYGDVEMVTPEDDLTAILRLTRGTVLTPCGAATPGGFGRAHLQVRAATFCTAHVLNAQDLWRVAVKYKSSILHFKRCLVALKEAKADDGKPLMSRTDFVLEIAGCYIMRN